MSYEFYKVLHVASIFFFISGISIGLLSDNESKGLKIITGATSFLILVAGMGLLARIGVSHGQAFPGWIVAKVLFWAILAIGGPVVIKRFPDFRRPAYGVFMALLVLSALFAIYKPF